VSLPNNILWGSNSNHARNMRVRDLVPSHGPPGSGVIVLAPRPNGWEVVPNPKRALLRSGPRGLS
jgi:hypothetical protein